MPSKPHNPTLPTFYLDQSTLSDAFRSAAVSPTGASAPYRQLFAWIQEVSSQANLCLSHAHVVEMAAWSEADAMAAWLDSLDVVWLRSHPEVQRAEDEYLVRLVAGSASREAPSPFAPSFLTSFGDRVTSANLSGMLSNPTIFGAVQGARQRASQGERDFMPDFHAMLRRDREMAAASGISEQRLQDGLAYNMRVALRTRAGEAHERLVERADLEYLATGATWGSVQDPFVERYENDPTALPVTRIVEAYTRGFERETASQRPNSRAVRRRHASAFFDLAHAGAAAAYCDVFTCDDFTARCLGDIRARWSRSPPVARRPGEEDATFVGRLMATWPQPAP